MNPYSNELVALLCLSIPKKYQSDKVLEKLSGYRIDTTPEKLIKFKTHMCFIENYCGDDPKYLTLLNDWKTISSFRLKEFRKILEPLTYNRMCSIKAINLPSLLGSDDYLMTRYFNDFDVVVEKEKIEKVRSILMSKYDFITGNTSFPTFEFIETVIDKQRENSHYELFQMSKLYSLDETDLKIESEFQDLIKYRFPVCIYDNKLHVHLTLDLHKSISADVNANLFWGHFTETTGSSPFERMTIEDHIWYTATKAYYEIHVSTDHSVKDRLRTLVDLYILLVCKGNEISMSKLLNRIQKLSLYPAMYYTLDLMTQLVDFEQLDDLKSETEKALGKPNLRKKDYGPLEYKLVR